MHLKNLSELVIIKQSKFNEIIIFYVIKENNILLLQNKKNSDDFL